VATISDAIRFHFQILNTSLAGMSRTITAEAIAAAMSADGLAPNASQPLHDLPAHWPFVTPDAFEVLGAGVRSMSGAEIILLAPLVQESQLEAWGEYSVANGPRWMRQSQTATIAADEANKEKLVITQFAPPNPPNPFVLDLDASIHAISTGNASLSFSLSKEKRPGGPYFPVWSVTVLGDGATQSCDRSSHKELTV
jgi:hypothetical protein